VDAIVGKAQLANNVVRALMENDADRPPRIGVCAVNPHAGEAGLFGDEERLVIGPAVRQLLAHGLDVAGPFPADTLMHRAAAGEFDALVAMYHDQGHIPLKLLDPYRAVNITLGLPIIRTSVAHGTAFEVAWRGKAEHRGMVEAVVTAAQLAPHRHALTCRPAGAPHEKAHAGQLRGTPQ
jgi:4-hydroxythreonine-4-phosphate dehydrogenase